MKSGVLGEERDTLSESKSTVDAGSTGPLNAGKLLSPLAASEVKFTTGDHYPIITTFASGAAITGLE